MLLIDRLLHRIDETACPVVVGLDPTISDIPTSITTEAMERYGNTRRAAVEAIFSFNEQILEAIKDLVPAVKLQIACYELYGGQGLDIFERTVCRAKKLGLIVINDAKRNDIGNTSTLYALGYLGKTPLIKGGDNFTQYKADFMTINPFLGSDNTQPFLEQCRKNDKGLFILARTSNPSALEYQEAKVGGLPLYQKIAKDINKVALEQLGQSGFSAIGAVVGATWPDEAVTLREIMPHSYFLIPGYGFQGAKAKDVIASFNREGYGGLVNSSRGIIFAYKQERYKGPDSFISATVKAVIDMRDDLLTALKNSGRLPKNW